MSDVQISMLEVAEILRKRVEPPRWSPPTGEQIKDLRESLGLSQAEFAERFSIDVASLRNWEQNRNIPENASRQLLWMIQADPNAALRLIYQAKKLARSQ